MLDISDRAWGHRIRIEGSFSFHGKACKRRSYFRSSVAYKIHAAPWTKSDLATSTVIKKLIVCYLPPTIIPNRTPHKIQAISTVTE